MKTASNVFSVIGIIANFIVGITMFQYGNLAGFFGLILAIITTIIAMCGIASSRKHIGLGILMILFVNLFSGIFYLCWDD